MGYGSATQCYNAAKSWALGWYDERQQEVAVSELPVTFTMTGLADNGIADADKPVSVKVGDDLYLQYQQNKNFINVGRQGLAIVQSFNQNPYGYTNFLGNIDVYEPTLTIDNFEDSGKTLVIGYCSEAPSETTASTITFTVYFHGQIPQCDQALPITRLENNGACWSVNAVSKYTTPEECEHKCGVTEGCVSWAYYYNDWRQICHLCDRISPSPVACDAGQVCTVWGTLREGNEYTEPVPPTSLLNYRACTDVGSFRFLESADECEAVCGSVDGCVSYSYEPHTTNKDCRLCSFTRWDTVIRDCAAEGGVCSEWGAVDDSVTYTPPPGWFSKPNVRACSNAGTINGVLSVEDCESYCGITKGCTTFSYDHTSRSGSCRLCEDGSPWSTVTCADKMVCETWGRIDIDTAYEEPQLPPNLDNYKACNRVDTYYFLGSFEECETVCGLKEDCESFSFQSGERSECRLCDTTTDYEKVVNCEEAGGLCSQWGLTNPSTDYKMFPALRRRNSFESCWYRGYQDNVESMEECVCACLDTEGCLSVDYRPNLWYKRCHLCGYASPQRKIDAPSDSENYRQWASLDFHYEGYFDAYKANSCQSFVEPTISPAPTLAPTQRPVTDDPKTPGQEEGSESSCQRSLFNSCGGK